MIPYPRRVMVAVLAFVAALPTGYYGYQVRHADEMQSVESVDFGDRYHKIARVKDGDTVVTASGEVVRLIGVDAPELGECFSLEARQALVGLVADREVYFTSDEEATDQYGRLLRYMFVRSRDVQAGDIHVNKELIRLGYADAMSIAPNVQYRNAFARAAKDAQTLTRGGWGACDTPRWHKKSQDNQPPNSTCTIKGNISADGVKRYSHEHCRSYQQITIDPAQGEAWFCGIAEARAAGYIENGDCF